MIEEPVALHQAEAARTGVGKGRGGRAGRVVERAPDALAGAGPQRQAVGIVDLRPPIDGRLLLGLREPEHGRQRRDAETGEVAPEVEGLVHVHDYRRAAAHDEAESPGETRTV